MVYLRLQVNIIQEVSSRDIRRALKSSARNNFIRSAALSQGCVLDRLSVVLRCQLYQKQCKLKKQVPETANKYLHSLCSMTEVFLLSLSFYNWPWVWNPVLQCGWAALLWADNTSVWETGSACLLRSKQALIWGGAGLLHTQVCTLSLFMETQGKVPCALCSHQTWKQRWL